MARKKHTNQEQPFLEHLEELRWRLLYAALYVVLFAVLAFLFRGFIFDQVILAPKKPEFLTNQLLCQLGSSTGLSQLCINSNPFNIINIKMAGQFSIHIKVSLLAGIIVSFPFIIREFWKFVKPALQELEQRMVTRSIFFSSLLFFAGVLFGFYVISPLSVNFLGNYSVSADVTNQINLGSYISTVSAVVLSSAVIFELPVLIYLLSKAGIVTTDFLKRYRKHAIVLILGLAAIITPPDIFSQVLVCVPLIVLYEGGIMIARRIETRDFPAPETYEENEETDEAEESDHNQPEA